MDGWSPVAERLRAAGVSSREGEPPAVAWARALKEASRSSASRLTIPVVHAHGTDMFAADETLVREIADWLAVQLRGAGVPPSGKTRTSG
jgi:hypothetical protein